jgi:hypothetical protein
MITGLEKQTEAVVYLPKHSIRCPAHFCDFFGADSETRRVPSNDGID